mmetsp:Transcript_23332/g.48799  ORF Transcript_23332/g.48799 Transcript_23332/m.48799 type:complete len:258 (-) Transcript_23332:850-1623(-)
MRIPMVMPLRLLIRFVQCLQHGVLRSRRGKHRERHPVVRIHQQAAHRDADRVTPHGRGGFLPCFLDRPTIIGQRAEELVVTDVGRHVHDFDTAVRLDEREEVTLCMTFDAISILALKDVVLHVRLVLVLLFVILLMVGVVRAVRRVVCGLRSNAQSARSDEVALRRTQVVRAIGIFFGDDSLIHIVQARQDFILEFESLSAGTRLFFFSLPIGFEGGESSAEPGIVEVVVEEGAYVVETVLGIIFGVSRGFSLVTFE